MVALIDALQELLASVIPTDSIVELTSALEGLYRDGGEGSFVAWEAMQAAIASANLGDRE